MLSLGLAVYRTTERSGVGEAVAILPSSHVAENVQTRYSTNPPTSGDHVVNEAPWGISTQPLPDRALVHNLEHGGIVLHY